MVGVFLGLAVPSALAGWFVVPLEYQASAIVRLSATAPRVMFDQPTRHTASYSQFANTQVALITGPAILSKVLAEPDVRELAWIREQEDPLHFLTGKIDARIRRGSELITVTCKAADRATALVVLQRTVEKYMTYALAELRIREGALRASLVEERDTLFKEWNTYRDRIGVMRKALEAPPATIQHPSSEAASYHQNLSRAEADLTTAQTKVREYNERIGQVGQLQERHKAAPDELIYRLGVETSVLQDQKVGRLRADLAAIEGQIAILQGPYRTGASKLTAERTKLASVQAQLAQAEREARGHALEALLAQYQYEHEAAEKLAEDAERRKEKFAALLAAQRGEALDLSQKMADINELEQKAEVVKRRHDRVNEQLYQHHVEQKAPARVSLAADPTAPTSPNYGKRFKVALLAIMASGCAGVAMGLWRELKDKNVRSPLDVSCVTSLPILASIPHASADRLLGSAQPAMLTADHPVSTTADEFRRILTRIIYPSEGSAELNTCLIASPSRGDGKTSLACNLAISLAQANRRVLLVDISSRHPSIEHCFGLEPAPGLGEILSSEASPTELVRPTDYPNLFVLGPGFRGKELVGKLASRDIVEFLEGAEEAFEHVVIDTPPALLMSDAKLLAPIVDGVVLVVGVGVSTMGMVRRCLQDMQQIGANVIGVVLNGLRPTRGGYLQRNLNLYYAYSQGADGNNGREIAKMKGEGESEEPMIMLVDERAQAEGPQGSGENT